MMDGRNCTGRRISLLNDSSDVTYSVPPVAAAKIQLPPPSALTIHSRSSSCVSTPSLSPETPLLVRSTSTDSRAFSTPSPITPPSNSFDFTSRHHSTVKPSQRSTAFPYLRKSSTMDEQHQVSMYPPIPDIAATMAASAYPMPAPMPMNTMIGKPHPTLMQQQQTSPPLQSLQLQSQQQQQQQQPTSLNSQDTNAIPLYRASTSPSSEPSRVSTLSAASNNKPQPKKSVYPCPMAKQVGCTDFFTTSGHAARHAKKHTGKKDAFCPECNKAFTRKDNMEQHRRTHQNNGRVRHFADDSKVKKNTKATGKKVPAKTDAQLEAAVEQQLADQIAASQVLPAPAVTTQSLLPPVTSSVLSLDPLTEQAMLLNPLPLAGTPYFVNTIDAGPIPALPMAVPDLMSMRPPLHRSNIASSLDYVPPAPLGELDSMHYSYPSPGLSNGLNSLALVASEQRRIATDEKSGSGSPLSQVTPTSETETP